MSAEIITDEVSGRVGGGGVPSKRGGWRRYSPLASRPAFSRNQPIQQLRGALPLSSTQAMENQIINPDQGQRWNGHMKKPKNKVRTKQPKKVKFVATEIRCKEASKGGLKFDVIIADPAIPPPKRPGSPNNKDKDMSVETIEGKLKAAEERRLSLEANKMATLAAQLSKIEETSRKKDEQNNAFICQTKEALDQKMETHTEKREQYISEIKTKLKDHLESVEKSRHLLDQQTEVVRKTVEEKLQSAAANRDENLKKFLDRLKEHEHQVLKVRENWEVKIKGLESQLQNKMESALSRKQRIEAEQREKLHTLNNLKFNEIKQTLENMEKQNEEKVKEISVKLETAESKREMEKAKKLESVRKNEKRAELVRQNKERLSQCDQEIISSA